MNSQYENTNLKDDFFLLKPGFTCIGSVGEPEPGSQDFLQVARVCKELIGYQSCYTLFSGSH